MELLLSRKPSLIEADKEGCNAFFFAAKNGHAPVVELLLTKNPEGIKAVDQRRRTVLHMAVEGFRSNPQLLERLWRMHPAALWARDSTSRTPLSKALFVRNPSAVEVLQWGFSPDELDGISKGFCQRRLRPIITQQCEGLRELLNQDMMTTVFEYLGFECVKRARNEER